MDVATLGATLALAKKVVLPQAASEDKGSVLVVDNDGEWAKGTAIGQAVVTVNNQTLSITTQS